MMQKQVLYFSLCGVFFNVSSQSYAQVHTQINGIETLVVIGERMDGAVVGASTLEANQLQPGSRADAAELLQGINGIQADSRSNLAQDTRVTLRGFGARAAFGVRGVELQIDGIPLSMPDGQGQFSGVMLDGVESINVLTGPLASLYGNGAGGVINLRTKAPEHNSLSVDTAADEDGLARHHFRGTFVNGKLAGRVQASRLIADGTRPHASATREQVGAQVYYQFENGVEAQWRFDKEDAPLLQDPLGLTQAQWQTDPYQINTSAEFFDTRKSISHDQHALTLRQAQGDQRWQFALWQGDRHVQQFLAQKGDALGSSGGVVDLDREFAGGNGNYSWDFNLANHAATFTLGGEWSAMDDDRKGYVNDGGRVGDMRRNQLDQAENKDIYGLLQWQITDQWQWLIGARQSQVELSVTDFFIIPGKNADDSGEKKFNRNAGSLATRYELDEHLSLHAAIGSGFETPTLSEMAYTNGDKGFNNTLDAAINRQQEIGLDYQINQINIGLTVFIIKTRDELVVDQSVNGRTTYINATETERKGVELSTYYEIGSHVDLRLALNYLDAMYTQGEFNGLQLPGVAKQNHYAQINWSPFSNDKLKFGLSVNHRDRVAVSDNNQVNAPSYTTFDISAAGNLNFSAQTMRGFKAGWWIKVANLTNQTYVGSVIVNQANGRAFESGSGKNLAGGAHIGYEF